MQLVEKPAVDLTDDEKSVAIMTCDVGVRTVPVILQLVPNDCREGFGTWTATKSECVMCPFVAACFCRSTNTPPRAIQAAKRNATRKPRTTKESTKMETQTESNAVTIKSILANTNFDSIDKAADIGSTLRGLMKGRAATAKTLGAVRTEAKEKLGLSAGFEDHTVLEHEKFRDYHVELAGTAEGDELKAAHELLATAHSRAIALAS